jgi:hypothetical protein
MNGPSDQGFLAAAMALDLIGANIPIGDQTGIPVQVGISEQFRRQIPLYLEPGLIALGGENARTQAQLNNTSFEDLVSNAPNGLFGFYNEIIDYGVSNPQWYQEVGGAPPTRADLALMVQAYENNINSIGGSITTEEARIAFTSALYDTLYQADGSASGFTPYGLTLLNEYVPGYEFDFGGVIEALNVAPNGSIDQ